jgi:Ca-activated chloride channel family protein
MLIRLLRELPSQYRIALVTFADKVHVSVRPTFDRARVVAKLPKEVTPLGGTSIGEAITQALAVTVGAVGKGVPGDPYPPGAMVLVSDGDQTDVGTRPQDAAQLASSVGIPVHTVAIGTQAGSVVQPVEGQKGGQNQTQTIAVPVEPFTLQQVAQTSGGRAFTGTGTARLVQTLEAVGSHTSRGRSPRELNVAAAGAALVFIVAGLALSGLWFGRIA